MGLVNWCFLIKCVWQVDCIYFIVLTLGFAFLLIAFPLRTTDEVVDKENSAIEMQFHLSEIHFQNFVFVWFFFVWFEDLHEDKQSTVLLINQNDLVWCVNKRRENVVIFFHYSQVIDWFYFEFFFSSSVSPCKHCCSSVGNFGFLFSGTSPVRMVIENVHLIIRPFLRNALS